MNDFWKTWFRLWCLGVAMFGAVLAGGGFAATQGPVTLLMETLGGARLTYDPALRFSLAVMGAVSIGWGVTFYGTMQVAFRGGENAPSLWRWLVGSVLTWFVIDTALSVATGFALNAVPNILLLSLLLIPVLKLGLLRKTAG
jgi:hypothetical protein